MLKTYTRAEVAQHNNNKSAWIVIHNNIYDVTTFLNEHPGGEEVLLEQAGRDGSEAFEDVGHSSDAREMMVKYKIGQIADSEKKPIKEKPNSWSSADTENNTQSSWMSWILPVTIGIIGTIVYRFYFSSH